MKPKSSLKKSAPKAPAERVVKDIRRATRRHFSAEDKIRIVLENERVRPAASEVDRLFAGIQKAESEIGWKPAYAGRDGLKRGLAETIAWFRDEANLRHYKSGQYNI